MDRTERRVVGLLVLATLAFLGYGIAAESPSLSYYIPITIVLVAAVGLIHRSVGFAPVTLWALAAIAIGNLAGGLLLIDGTPLYEHEAIGAIRYDKVYHTIATGVAAWASYEAALRWTGRPRPALVFVAFMMAAGAGAMVEVVEYFGTLIRENTIVGDYRNNMEDLLANTAGAAIGVVVAVRFNRPAR